MQWLWRFLLVKRNREVLAWVGTGVVVVAGGLWTAVTFFATTGGGPPGPSIDCSIEANRGIAACGDQHFQGPVTLDGGSPGRE